MLAKALLEKQKIGLKSGYEARQSAAQHFLECMLRQGIQQGWLSAGHAKLTVVSPR